MALDIRRFQAGRAKRDATFLHDGGFTSHWVRRGRCLGSVSLEFDDAQAMLMYQVKDPDGSSRCLSASIGLAVTACHLGGQRAWWLCPKCDRRTAVVYLWRDEFACRQCQRLGYPSQLESKEDRALRSAGKVRRRLGWEPGIANPAGSRPKGMHGSTFRRLKDKHDAAARIGFYELARWLGHLRRL